ncbi:MAG: beta-galactosidase, partial [Alphaproteobacteria bacterium]
MKNTLLSGLIILIMPLSAYSQKEIKQHTISDLREHLLFDSDWRFSPGHAKSYELDFYNGTGYFTWFAKAGYGDGPAAPGFEDRTWREVDLPHDWAVELPYAPEASHSHGYRTIGWEYPETSVGWYRKKFIIPDSDLGRKISIRFDGIYRDATVWINGFYLGNEPSGYTATIFDITDYLNYGGENVVTVRVDASIEEGWFYEGAGIYRHVWLSKTDKLHVSHYGTFITTIINSENAELTLRTTVENQYSQSSTFTIEQTLIDEANRPVVSKKLNNLLLKGNQDNTYYQKITVQNPTLWSVENPYLYQVRTDIISNGKTVDSYFTTIGIRTVRFDPDAGFFLNGKN